MWNAGETQASDVQLNSSSSWTSRVMMSQKKGHDCSVGKCKNCGMGHNILLCPKDQDDCDKMFLVNEESSSDEFTEDETNYSTNQEEMVFLTRKIQGAKIEGKNNGETNKNKDENKNQKIRIP